MVACLPPFEVYMHERSVGLCSTTIDIRMEDGLETPIHFISKSCV